MDAQVLLATDTATVARRAPVAVVATQTIDKTFLGKMVRITTGSATIVVTMPSAGMISGDTIEIMKGDTGAGKVQIAGLGATMGAPIDDALFARYDWVQMWYDGSAWVPLRWTVKTRFDVFTTSGTFNKYPLALEVVIEGVGAGGGAGGGRQGASASQRYGGGPGGIGAMFRRMYSNSVLPSSGVSVVIGAGGTGGAGGASNDASGVDGTAGGSTTFGATTDSFYIIGRGGGLGIRGTSGSGGAGTNYVADFAYNNSNSPGAQSGGPVDPQFQVLGLLPLSGAGSSLPTGNTPTAGVAGILGQANFGPGTAGIAGTVSTGAAAGNGTQLGTGPENWWWSAGPGSGGSSITSAGGRGGDAVGRGVGGAGGGASQNGFSAGRGGDGGPGYLQVKSTF